MSDTPPLEHFLKWKLSIESPSLAYAAKAVTRNVILAVDIPLPLLRAWSEFLKTQKAGNQFATKTCSGSYDNPITLFSYVDLFEYSIPGNTFAISTEKDVRSEVNESLRKLASAVQDLYSKAKGGRKREELNSKVRRFHIFEGQTASVEELRRENNLMRDEIDEWKKKLRQPRERERETLP